jgi:DNA repair ATPase RecN
VQVENFRAFQSAEMRLPGNGLVLVAGANNAGKTALLSAFDAITGDYGDVTSLRHGGSEEPARLRATFDLDQAERAAILENASGGAVLAATIFTPAVSGGWHTGRARWARTRPERR